MLAPGGTSIVVSPNEAVTPDGRPIAANENVSSALPVLVSWTTYWADVPWPAVAWAGVRRRHDPVGLGIGSNRLALEDKVALDRCRCAVVSVRGDGEAVIGQRRERVGREHERHVRRAIRRDGDRRGKFDPARWHALDRQGHR